MASASIIGQLATQQYAQLAKSQPEQYILESVYYGSLEEAKEGVRFWQNAIALHDEEYRERANEV